MKEQIGDHLNRNFLKVLSIISFFLFLLLLFSVLSNGKVLELDKWVSTNVPSLQTPVLTDIVIFITNINGVTGSTIFSLFFIMFLLYKKYYQDLQFYLLAFLGASALFTVIKLLVERTRPVLKIINEQGFSFPSGHSTMSMVIALSLYVIFVKKIRTLNGRMALLIFCIVWPIIIVSTRLYLNVHWLSDTVAGLSLGIFWVTLTVYLFEKRAQKKNIKSGLKK